MRRFIWIFSLLAIAVTAILFFSIGIIKAAADELVLSSPASCPSSGCAAGQRLNFQVSFSVSPNTSTSPNTQVCVYTPIDGQSGSGTIPWALSADLWISNSGILSSIPYTSGETSSVCSNNADPDQLWLMGAYGTYATSTSDILEFAFNISPSTDVNGNVNVKIFQTDSGGSWIEASTYSDAITIAPSAHTAYVGQTATDCGLNSPCYINSGDDGNDGLGTGLRDAVMASSNGDEIRILNDYVIKDHTVQIDKDVTIRGQEDAMITYIGVDCSMPMLSFTQGGTLADLTINDGNCGSPSRNLVEIDSPENVAIEHNTFNNGYQAIYINNNTGDITIAFNQIARNIDYAIYRTSGLGGEVSILANNIVNNRNGYQVNCNSHGNADHNYWGDGVLTSNSALNCIADNVKRLGAPVVLSTETAGVEAVRKQVTANTTYAFDNQVGVRHSLGTDYNVIIVNHGQGDSANIPFFNADVEQIQPCSNFYDIFLEENSAASNLVLSLKYDLNNSCINTIETSSYCLSADMSQYPLWWYDPENYVTDGWDKTGQNPQGPGAGGVSGQQTTCDISNNLISVTIDNTGRPGLSNDLIFTPFAAGLSIPEGIQLTQFTAVFSGSKNDLKWITSSENNVKGFHILRSETEAGPYVRVTPLIPAIGDPYIGGVYNYADTDIVFVKTYYYKIEVINNQDESIGTHGPVSVWTATATPTRTPTRTPYPTYTPYPTRTSTPYFYRSPTSYYRPVTSTPRGYPTQVRTYGPSPSSTLIGTRTQSTSSVITGSSTPFSTSAYPVENEKTSTLAGYPVPGEEEEQIATQTAIAIGEVGTPQPNQTTSPDKTPSIPEPEEEPGESGEIRWPFLAVGALSGLILIGITSFIVAKIRF